MRILRTTLLLLLVSTTALAAVKGRVSSSSGVAIEHARIEVVGKELVTFSAPDGRFDFEVETPVTLAITHSRFEPQVISVESGSAQPLVISLVAKQEIYEEIAVSASRGEVNFAPVSVDTSVIEPDQMTVPPSTLTEMVSEVPAVSENGQGGLLQAYSVRGVSRLRVLTLISGMRINSERRAGVSASFLDPRLMGSVDVVRGPSSTYYGSGALGGMVQLFPRNYDRLAVDAGYWTQGDENYQALGWGDGKWSLGIARQDASNSETPDGEILNSAFNQLSGTAQRQWDSGGLQYQLLAIGSRGKDIGKANTDFPDRTTIYPDEKHGLLRFAVRSDSSWMFEAWAHPNSLETRVEDSESLNVVDNEAVDFGANWVKSFNVRGTESVRLGLDYSARRNVQADEVATDLGSGDIDRQSTLDEGQEDDAGLYGAVEWNVGRTVILAGARAAWQRQRNGDRPSADDSAVSGFAGLVAPLGGGFEVVSNLGTGLRFPSLSERFFSGTTGRGEVIGNPNLDPERSLSVDAGLRWYGDKLFVAGFLFHNDIGDYVERIEIEPELLTFVNLTSGTIRGAELDGFYQFDPFWKITFSGHLLEGRDDEDRPLADIPANRFALGGRWQRGRWAADARWEQRSSKTDPGQGEKPIPSASLLSASVEYQLPNGLALSLSGRNLLDESYFNSADDKVPFSPGRAIGLSLRWQARPSP